MTRRKTIPALAEPVRRTIVVAFERLSFSPSL
jgi:hypothetical protein